MTDDKIAEIRARHKAVTWCFYETKSQIHDDREVLLAEVERLTRERDEARAEVERLKSEPETLRAELIAICNASRAALANAYDRARGSRKALQAKP